MSFIENLKKAFGFGPDNPDEWTDDEATSTPSTPATLAAPTADTAATSVDFDPQMAQAIFTKVVEVFNASLPDFLQRSADPARQRQYLYDALDQSIKDYLSSLRMASDAVCQNAWERDKAEMHKQMEALQKRAADLEARRGEVTERQLSVERQKRALTERVRDLEEQLSNVEAEKEQYQLEAQSLLNKMKVASVHESDFEALQAEVNRLRAEKLGDQDAALAQENADLRKQLEDANAEHTKMLDAVEAAKVKMQMSDQMVAEIRAKVAEKDAKIADLEASIQSHEDEIAKLEKERADAVPTEALEDMMKQIELFEDVKAKMNGRIDGLKEKLAASRSEVEGLHQTIKDSEQQHAQAQRQLRDQIDAAKAEHGKQVESLTKKVEELTKQLESAKSQHDEELAKLRAQRSIDMAAEAGGKYDAADEPEYDELLSGEDWLVATPAKDTSMRPATDDPDFGYQAPPKRQKHPANKHQKSLFD